MQGHHPDVYAFEVPPDAVPCDVQDLEHGWRILDHQPLTAPSTSQSSHYNL